MSNHALVLLLTILAPLSSALAETIDVPATPREAIFLSAETEIAFDRSGKRLTSKTLADGSVLTDHNGSLQNVTVARVGPDGSIETYCTTDREVAVDWMARLEGRPDRGRRDVQAREE